MLLCPGSSSPSHLWPHWPCMEVISAVLPHGMFTGAFKHEGRTTTARAYLSLILLLILCYPPASLEICVCVCFLGSVSNHWLSITWLWIRKSLQVDDRVKTLTSTKTGFSESYNSGLHGSIIYVDLYGSMKIEGCGTLSMGIVPIFGAPPRIFRNYGGSINNLWFTINPGSNCFRICTDLTSPYLWSTGVTLTNAMVETLDSRGSENNVHSLIDTVILQVEDLHGLMIELYVTQTGRTLH